jgi:hypothetical protein
VVHAGCGRVYALDDPPMPADVAYLRMRRRMREDRRKRQEIALGRRAPGGSSV